MKGFFTCLALAGLVLFPAAPTWAQSLEFTLRELPPPAPEAVPPLPDPGVYPTQLVVDDNSTEAMITYTDIGGAVQFLWFNQFAAPGDPFELREIWVLFPSDPGLGPGDAIQLVVYEDIDSTPADGANLLLTLDETIQVADGNTFSIYTLPDPLMLSGEQEVLLGVINRYVQNGAPVTLPATIDTDVSQGRSWVAVWNGDPPSLPVLPPNQILFNLDDFLPGNFMIRGFGVGDSALSIPTLGSWGRGALVLLLAAAACGLMVLRR